MKIRFVTQEGLGRMGVLSTIGYRLDRKNEQGYEMHASVTFATDCPDEAVTALRRLAQQLEDRLDGMTQKALLKGVE